MTIKSEGLGYSAGLPGAQSFFWDKTTAGKFCHQQAKEQIIETLNSFLNTMERASWVGLYYQSIRKDQAFQNIHTLISDAGCMNLLQLANSVVENEQDLCVLAPSKKHPYYEFATQLIDGLIWQCISYRKQLKAAV